jgi:hypothetical protein
MAAPVWPRVTAVAGQRSMLGLVAQVSQMVLAQLVADGRVHRGLLGWAPSVDPDRDPARITAA